MFTETYVARRSFEMGGRRYRLGQKVRTDDLTTAKVAQLVGLRYIQLKSLPPMQAARRFTFAGQAFAPGEPFSLEGVRSDKVTQLLEHRFIQPSPATA